MDDLVYPLPYNAPPGVTLMKATKPAPGPATEATSAPARPMPLAGQTQTYPLQGKR